MLAFVMFRCGLIFPVGYMTYSSCLPQRKSMRGECAAICTFGLLMTIFYLIVIFGIMGVLGKKMGVELSAVYVPCNYELNIKINYLVFNNNNFSDRGIFLAVIPEFLIYYNNSMIFAICYYFALIFPEIVRYVRI